MRQSLLAALSLLLTVLAFAPAAAQDEEDIAALFGNRRFYEENDVLEARGDVGFVADVWTLPGRADSARVLLGVALGNADLQFVRTSEGRWQADYTVRVQLVDDGRTVTDETWEKSVDVATFDETLLPGETIVFQTELAVLPGTYDLDVSVRDENADDSARVEAEIEVPEPAGDLSLAEPVLLRLYRETGPEAEYIVHPSHYYPDIPEQVDVLVEAGGAEPGASYAVRARLSPESEVRDEPPALWQGTATADSTGRVRAFASVPNDRPRFGEYLLTVSLEGPAESEESRTSLLVAGSSGWIIDNWDKALSLVKYEATGDELDILEDIQEPEKRVEAWNCFWRMRDPAPATPSNEALQAYFQKIQIANANWTSALRPGYLSDRGRVFITLGAPDEIFEEELPRESRPFEVWQYNRYNFRILFVDRIGFNNYQIDNIGTYQRELGVIERRKHRFLEERADQCPLLAPAFRDE